MIARVSAPGTVAHDRPHPADTGGQRDAVSFPSTPTSESIRRSIGCALIIHLIIQTIGLDPSGAVWTDEASNVSRPDPSGADQIDAEHPSRNRKVEGSNPSSGSIAAGRRLSSKTGAFGLIRRWQPDPPDLALIHLRVGSPSGEWCGRAEWCASRD